MALPALGWPEVHADACWRLAVIWDASGEVLCGGLGLWPAVCAALDEYGDMPRLAPCVLGSACWSRS